MAIDIGQSVVIVSGANRGLGRALAAELLKRGAKVYAGARNPANVDLPDAIPLRLDVTDPDSVAAAAAAAPDVTVLVNNAGSSTGSALVAGELADIRLEMDTHYYGTLAMTRAFAPVIAGNGGGAVLNILSVLSWLHLPVFGGYSAAKAATWSLTNSTRLELAPRDISVHGLHVGFMDTDMAAGVDAPKTDPAVVAALAADALRDGDPEILADAGSREFKAKLSQDLVAMYPQLVPARRTTQADAPA